MDKRNIVKNESDNLIYNRYDLIFESYELLKYSFDGKNYEIMIHMENGSAYLNLWGKCLPQGVFDKVITDVFEKYADAQRVCLVNCKNNYGAGDLALQQDILLRLPSTVDDLMSRLKQKHRYNLKREKRILERTCGEIGREHYSFDMIPDALVLKYFEWKKESHGTDYGMLPSEYLKRYHVTDMFVVTTGNDLAGIAFYCKVGEVAYFENFTYNPKLASLSAGFITYELLLEYLIDTGVSLFYLGGGEYEYKRFFDSEISESYSGHIYRNTVFEKANRLFSSQDIKRIIIYGLGKYGKEFLRYKGYFEFEIIGGIDRKAIEIDGMPTYIPDNNLPNADAAIITMKRRSTEVEKFLSLFYSNVYYMSDLLGVYE